MLRQALPSNSVFKSKIWFWIAMSFVLLTNAVLLYEGLYIGLLFPALLIGILIGVFSFDKLIFLTIFCIPFSVRYEDVIAGIGLDIPTDPLLIILSVAVTYKLLSEKKYDVNVLKHPITIALFFNLGWIFFTSFTSSLPLVSFKYFLSRSFFILLFYFMLIQIFRENKKIKTFMWLYIIPLGMVIIYAFVNHYDYNFDQRASYGIAQPYYVNHGIYAAAIAMYIPFLWYVFTKPRTFNYSIFQQSMIGIVFLLFMAGLTYSYTRAAWISVLAAACVGSALAFRFKFSTYFFGAILLIIGAFSIQDSIEKALRKNKTVSSDNFEQHVKSIYNVKNDDSNLERINRWMCALRMFEDHPILGFGPGTYMFEYAPYQKAKEMTKISTNMATLGNCHSEYLQPLAEIGLIGFLSWIGLIITMIATSIKIYYRDKDAQNRLLVLSAMLGLITYFVHGTLNNYIELDKSAVFVWGFMAVITCIDVYHRKDSESEVLIHE
ncbi:MAG: O-antigen ligase family protein [Bacteroidetes bacterium]|nr:O-antigen ligase family protein [Bacteroidota bacterium]